MRHKGYVKIFAKCIVCFLIAFFGGAGVSVSAEEATDTVQYQFEDGVMTISGEGTANKLTELDGQSWYYYQKNTTKIILGEGISAIGSSAFQDFTLLEEIVFPTKMDTIGSYAFYECKSLKELSIPKGVYYYGTNCFGKCTALEKISFGVAYKKTGWGLGSKYGIENDNFEFLSCTDSLKEITVDENHAFLQAKDNVLFSKDGTHLLHYPAAATATEYHVPDGTENIHAEAFRRQKYLKKLTMADSVNYLGKSSGSFRANAFEAMESLEEI